MNAQHWLRENIKVDMMVLQKGVHRCLCGKYKLEVADKCYEHVPGSLRVRESENPLGF